MLVYGGGNVAYDVARSSVRLGAEVTVVCLENREKGQMTADDEEIDQAAEEGVKLYSGYSNSGFTRDENGRVTGLNCFAISDFRFGPGGLEVDAIPGTEVFVPCDVVVYASGQKTNLDVELRPGAQPARLSRGPGDWQVRPEDQRRGACTPQATWSPAPRASSAPLPPAGMRPRPSTRFWAVTATSRRSWWTCPPPIPTSAGLTIMPSCPGSTPTSRPCDERRCSFVKVDNNFTEEQAKTEAARCLKCPLRLQLHRTKLWTEY